MRKGITLTPDQMDLLAWLSRDHAAYGECKGPTLDELVKLDLAGSVTDVPDLIMPSIWPPKSDFHAVGVEPSWRTIVGKKIASQVDEINQDHYKRMYPS